MSQTDTTLETCITEIHTFLGDHFADLRPGEVAELRILNDRGADSGFFDDLEEMAQLAAVLDDDGWAVYYGLNPRRASVCDELNEMGSRVGGKDTDVTRRCWLYLDFDPDKTPEGKGQCATKSEKNAARSRVQTVVKWLNSQGFGTPKIVDSGNGYHVLYRVDLASDTELCEGVLKAIKAEFDIAMDSVFDAARIARLPGSLNRKGKSTAERPHRRAKLAGGTPNLVSAATLRKVVIHAPQSQPTRRTKPVSEREDLPIPETRWALAKGWLSEQAAAVEGDGGDKQTFTVCCFLARDYALEWDDAWDLLREYNERCDPPWDEKDLTRKLRDAYQKAEAEPDAVGRAFRKRKASDNEDEKPEGAFETLVNIGRNAELCELWATPAKEPFASFEREGHAEHWITASDAFRHWLRRQYEDSLGGIVKPTALDEAQKAIGEYARMSGVEKEAPARVGFEKDQNVLWIDLCNQTWEAVRIDADGWNVVPTAGVCFRRNDSCQAPLPQPLRGGSLALLRPLVNVENEEWPLYLAFLLGCFLPTGMFPVGYATGSPDSGKSSLSRLTQSLIDPRNVKPSGIPKKDEMLKIAEGAGFLLVANNISKITQTESDQLCTLVEGAGQIERTLYSNKGLTLSQTRCPILLNGVGLEAERSDLLSRIIPLNLQPAKNRLGETDYEQECDRVRPLVLGALYDIVSVALRRWRDVQIEDPPRLVDLAKWVTASEPALLQDGQIASEGDMLRALQACRQSTGFAATEADPITPWLMKVVKEKGGDWTASTTEWLDAMNRIAERQKVPVRINKAWPRNVQSLGTKLRYLVPSIGAQGLGLEQSRDRHRKGWRAWLLEKSKTKTLADEAEEK